MDANANTLSNTINIEFAHGIDKVCIFLNLQAVDLTAHPLGEF